MKIQKNKKIKTDQAAERNRYEDEGSRDTSGE
jgi:hypothetical protein